MTEVEVLLGERCQFGSSQSGEAGQRVEHRSIRAREVAKRFAVRGRLAGLLKPLAPTCFETVPMSFPSRFQLHPASLCCRECGFGSIRNSSGFVFGDCRKNVNGEPVRLKSGVVNSVSRFEKRRSRQFGVLGPVPAFPLRRSRFQVTQRQDEKRKSLRDGGKREQVPALQMV